MTLLDQFTRATVSESRDGLSILRAAWTSDSFALVLNSDKWTILHLATGRAFPFFWTDVEAAAKTALALETCPYDWSQMTHAGIREVAGDIAPHFIGASGSLAPINKMAQLLEKLK